MKESNKLKGYAFQTLSSREMPSVEDFEKAFSDIDDDGSKLDVNDLVPEKNFPYRKESGMNIMIINLLKTYQNINKDYLPNGIQKKSF